MVSSLGSLGGTHEGSMHFESHIWGRGDIMLQKLAQIEWFRILPPSLVHTLVKAMIFAQDFPWLCSVKMNHNLTILEISQ